MFLRSTLLLYVSLGGQKVNFYLRHSLTFHRPSAPSARSVPMAILRSLKRCFWCWRFLLNQSPSAIPYLAMERALEVGAAGSR